MDNFRNDRSVNIKSLLGQFYRVADFQREYVWDEEDIAELINDIAESYKNSQPNYFLGAIVLTEADNNFLIVDGQQRITTLTIIISAIREVLKGKNQPVYNYLTQFISDKRMTAGVVEDCPRLTFGEDKSDKAIECLINNTDGLQILDEDSDTVRNIKGGFSFVIEYLGTIDIPIHEFVNFILGKVVLLPYITNNLKQALIVFETLNSKGRSLTPIDLLKNALFSSEDESNWDSLKLEWKKFKNSLNVLGESEKRFLKYYILVNHNEKIPEGDVFEWISNPKNTQMAENPFEFIDHIRSFADSYGFIIQNKGPDGIENKRIQNIRFLAQKGRQFFPLLISLRRLSNANPLYDRILLAVESLLFSYSIMRAYTGAIESTFSDWTKKLNTAQSDEEVLNFIVTDVEKEVKRLGQLAYEKLLVLTEKDIAKKKLQFLLLRIDIHLTTVAGGAYKSVSEYSNYEIEHIVPRKFNDQIVTHLNEKEHSEIVNKLGNLTILEKPLNRSIKNSGVNAKKSTYENSSFLLCKSSVQTIEGQNTLAKANTLVHKIGVMDKKDIETRQTNLADIYSSIYGWSVATNKS